MTRRDTGSASSRAFSLWRMNHGPSGVKNVPGKSIANRIWVGRYRVVYSIADDDLVVLVPFGSRIAKTFIARPPNPRAHRACLRLLLSRQPLAGTK